MTIPSFEENDPERRGSIGRWERREKAWFGGRDRAWQHVSNTVTVAQVLSKVRLHRDLGAGECGHR